MAIVTFTIRESHSGFEELAQRLQGFSGRVDSALVDAASDSADELLAAWKSELDTSHYHVKEPGDPRPHTIDTLKKGEVMRELGGATVSVGSDYDVADWLEHGTSRHWLEPTTKKAMRWYVDGVPVFSKGHQSGFIPAYAPLLKATTASEPTVHHIYDEQIRRAFEETFGESG